MIARMTAYLYTGRRLALAVLCLMLATTLFAAAPGQFHISSLSYVNAEIATVVRSLADISGANIVVAPDVKGTITLKLRDITVEDALRIIADMTGCSYRLEQGIYFFTATAGGKTTPNTPQAVAGSYAIIKLQAASAADIIAAMSMTYPDVQVKTLPDNRVILAGAEKRLQEAENFIGKIESTSSIPVETTIKYAEATYQVKAVVPWQAKAYLEELYRNQGLTVTFAPASRWKESFAPAPAALAPEGTTTEKVQPAPAQTGNDQWGSDTLILRAPEAVLAQALDSLAKIDIAIPQAQKRCSVKRIYATQAIAYLLEQFEPKGLIIITAPMTYTSNGEKGTTTAPASIGTRVLRDKDGKLNISEPVGDFILMGNETLVADAYASLEKIDIGPERVERVYTLRFLQVSEAKDKLIELYGAQGLLVTVAPSMGGGAGAAANTASKVVDLVLRGPQDVVTRAEQLIQSLDIASTQIAIKAQIFSVNNNDVKQLGIDWPGSISTKLNETQPGNPLSIGRIVRNPVSLDVALNLLESHNKAKKISEPSTVVQNGREALIHVGDKILYEVVSSYSNGTPVYSTTQVDSGVTLQVLPIMSKDGIITLQITTTISDLVGFTTGASGAQLPQIRETSSTTSVQVRDGETLVIGGMRQNGITEEKKGIPFVSDLPLIGGLFSTKSTKPSDSQIVIIVTPQVMDSLEANEAIKAEFDTEFEAIPAAQTTPAIPAN